MLGEGTFKSPPSRLSTTVFEGKSMAQPKVEIYTKMFCGYCVRAKRLLESKGVGFTEYDISMGGPDRDTMHERAPGAMTVPQIFIGDQLIGGSDDLAALDRAGKLDALLGL
jgi:glutaredoxin 3